ncbi:hypothetical protein [Dryocola sp. BD626]|uniref:hypothetical protein n=1 Tax=Dryocola sp. BD626 TaxID=3133273 RepID=UPI003F50A279
MYHSFTDALIHTQARSILTQYLWPDSLQAAYSLQCCQGDGVLFTGELATADLLRIIPRLHTLTASMSRELLQRVSKCGVTVRLTRNTHRYSHSGCVTLTAQGFPEETGQAEDHLLNALQSQYETICRTVETLGYRLTDGTFPAEMDEVLLCRGTENIVFRVVAVYPEECGYCDADDGLLYDYIDLILRCGRRVLCLRYEVFCDGEKMAESWTTGTVIDPHGPVRKWLSRDEVRYVASEARDAIEARMTAFRTFIKAA